MAEFPETRMKRRTSGNPRNSENDNKENYKQLENRREKDIPGCDFSEEETCNSCIEMLEKQRRTIILEIQQVAEKILKAHKIITRPGDLLKGDWFLKLQKPGFEKKLVLAKYGEEIFAGFYSYPDDIPLPDPNLVLLSQNGFWYPQRIEEKLEETVSSFFTGAYGDYDYLNIIPENLVKFQAFQRDFAETLDSQGWDKSNIKVLEKIIP